ncbi:hypothetical protein HMPREF9374_2064 [Desmospora sp. 8437]|nr:hypothetical protein HMPREF9374_2064 [Desmospora sp. 8437]
MCGVSAQKIRKARRTKFYHTFHVQGISRFPAGRKDPATLSLCAVLYCLGAK